MDNHPTGCPWCDLRVATLPSAVILHQAEAYLGYYNDINVAFMSGHGTGRENERLIEVLSL